ncbi:MAG: c-type cytochrome, partial [Abditibacteriales bacterium]|nr:c-type cytochrome [Abditibacteriales bacterium]MDW8367782.1 c-type cytochrome [Abditibacteriales bacterium]
QARADYYVRANQLIGDAAYQCISCHVRGKQTPEGKPPSDWAPDLSMAPQRLQPEWITDWLRNPQSLYPGTKMPRFTYTEYPDVFPGGPDKQIQAIKDFLMSGQIGSGAAPMVAARR